MLGASHVGLETSWRPSRNNRLLGKSLYSVCKKVHGAVQQTFLRLLWLIINFYGHQQFARKMLTFLQTLPNDLASCSETVKSATEITNGDWDLQSTWCAFWNMLAAVENKAQSLFWRWALCFSSSSFTIAWRVNGEFLQTSQQL